MSRRYVPDLNGHDVTLVAESIAPLERAIDVPVGDDQPGSTKKE